MGDVMPTELEDLDEIPLGPDRSARPDKRSITGRRNLVASMERSHAVPRWLKSLRSIKGQSALRKKVTR